MHHGAPPSEELVKAKHMNVENLHLHIVNAEQNII